MSTASSTSSHKLSSEAYFNSTLEILLWCKPALRKATECPDILKESCHSLFQSMLRLLVSSQVHFTLKAFSTQVTAKRFKTSVLSAVCYQIGTLTESFAAYLTFVRFFSCDIGEKNKCQLLIWHLRPTHFIRCYNLKIIRLIIRLGAGLSFLLYHYFKLCQGYVNSLNYFICKVTFCNNKPTCVNKRVFLHVWFLMKPLAAVLAWVRPRIWVDEKVRGQSRGSFKSFPAYFTIETPLLWKQDDR